jgi:hypothetical protein
MSLLTEEIQKRLNKTHSELVDEALVELEDVKDEKLKSKISGIASYHRTNQKLTEGQRESLIRFLAVQKTFTE